MALRQYFTKEKHSGLTVCEIILTIYIAITTVMTILFWDNIDNPSELIKVRLGFIVFMCFMYGIYRIYSCRLTWLLRTMPVLLSLVYWYPETYTFARCHPYLDHIFAHADWILFGYQPSLEFSKNVTSVFWSEMFNMGYYSYYFLMIGVLLFCFLRRYEDSQRYAFIFMASFFTYYLWFEWMPVAGPYYYFKAIGLEAARNGIYPDLGNYFATHNDLNNDLIHAEIRGIFSELVHGVQIAGENPVGAFPSSHVSMSTVTMIIAWHTRNKWLFWCLLPFYLLLCIATVYIMAHYFVDSIAGFLTACLFYHLYDQLYKKTISS